MNAKIKLVLAVVLALCFLGLSIGALEVVPKYIEDRYYVMGVEGKWSNLVSLLFYVMAVMCGFYGWLVFRHIKYKRRYGWNFGVSSYGLHLFALATDSCIGGSDTVCQHQWYGIVWMASWFGAWIVLPA